MGGSDRYEFSRQLTEGCSNILGLQRVMYGKIICVYMCIYYIPNSLKTA
jgi:hypothetical protein